MNQIEVKLETELKSIIEGLDGEINLPVCWIGLEEEQFRSVLARISENYPYLEIIMIFNEYYPRAYPEVEGNLHLRRKKKLFDKEKQGLTVESRFQPHFLGNWHKYSDKYGLKAGLDKLNEWAMCPTCRLFLVYKDETKTILECPECDFEKLFTPMPTMADGDPHDVWVNKRIREDAERVPEI